jgi:hypothetical protein
MWIRDGKNSDLGSGMEKFLGLTPRIRNTDLVQANFSVVRRHTG